MPDFPLGINTISDTWTIPMEDSLRRLAKLGYRRFDIMVSPAHLDTESLTPRDCHRIRQFLADEGIEIYALTAQSLDHNLASPRAEIRTMTLGFKKRLIDIAYELGATGIVTVSGRYNALNAPPRAQLEGWFRGSLESAVAYAEKLGVKLFLENIPMGVLPTTAQMVEWVRDFSSPSLSICYDVANGHFIGEDPGEAIRLAAPYLDLVHLSDTTQTAWKHDPIGMGDVDFRGAAEALGELNYQRLSVLEILAPDPDPQIVAGHKQLATLGWEQPV